MAAAIDRRIEKNIVWLKSGKFQVRKTLPATKRIVTKSFINLPEARIWLKKMEML